jgi:Ca-activated chloride channel family protein
MRRLMVILILFVSPALSAQTLLLKTGQPGGPVPAPTVSTDVRLRVRGVILRAEVLQKFVNPAPTCVDAVYSFPLPENAAVDTLRMTVGGRVIEGQIREREEAKKTFEQAKSEGKKATLVEQERPNLFTASISNVAAGEEIVVTIEYQETVDYRDGAFRVRFPMTAAPRYPAGAPDADRLAPQYKLPIGPDANRVSLSVDLDAGFTIRAVDSSYHQINVAPQSGSHYSIALAEGAVIADRDFELTWQPDLGSEPAASIFTESVPLAGKTGGAEHYALFMLLPPAPAKGVRLPRETIFIIDTSGSMGGPSIEQARAALLLGLDTLTPDDRFNVIEFNSVTNTLFESAVEVSPETMATAKQWVGALQSQGGTEMLPALEAALADQDPKSERFVRQVIFITDGQVANEAQLFAVIRSNLGRSRLFTVGIGSAPNSHFMNNAARFGRGTFTYIGLPEEVQEKMTTLFEKLERPVLRDVEVRFDDPAAEAWPARIPDLYAGEPLVVAVRLSQPTGRLIASGKAGEETWNAVHALSAGGENGGIGKLWARRKIDGLTDAMTTATEPSSFREEIIDLALTHRLVTSYTSLVAVDVTPAGTAVAACETRPVPLNLPAGWGGIDGSLPSGATPAPLLLLAGALFLSIAAFIALSS